MRKACVWLVLATVGCSSAEPGMDFSCDDECDPATTAWATGDDPGATGLADHDGSGSDAASTTGLTGDDDDDSDGFPDPPADIPNNDPVCGANDLDGLADGGAPSSCTDEGPPEAFDPVLEWSYPPRDGTPHRSHTIPLVINFNDDNGDGAIDDCDTPDVIVYSYPDGELVDGCTLTVLDGNYARSGLVHMEVAGIGMQCTGTPATADIDNDGEPEIVVLSDAPDRRLMAIDNDGTVMWHSDPFPGQTVDVPPVQTIQHWWQGAVGLFDIDGDGTTEIVYNHAIYNAAGQILWHEDDGHFADGLNAAVHLQESIAIDIDADGKLELITGHTGWDFDDGWTGTQLWDLNASGVTDRFASAAKPHVANLDDDPQPEILLSSPSGFMVIEADGTPWWPAPVVPNFLHENDCIANWAYPRPAAIANFDDDATPEIAINPCNSVFSIFDLGPEGLTAVFDSHAVNDASGASGATAFDFLGDGSPEAIYSDQTRGVAWSQVDGAYDEAFSVTRNSGTWMEYPIVADVDNDGSAEFLVVSSDPSVPVLQVFGDVDDRWIAARRIWNQQAYFVTNVTESGRIPATPVSNWTSFNTWRVNSQIEGNPGGVSVPCVPAG